MVRRPDVRALRRRAAALVAGPTDARRSAVLDDAERVLRRDPALALELVRAVLVAPTEPSRARAHAALRAIARTERHAAEALRTLAEDAWNAGRIETATAAVEASLSAAQTTRDRALARLVQARLAMLQHDLGLARERVGQALALVKEQDLELECRCHVLLAAIASHALSPEAPRHARRAVGIARGLGPALLAPALAQLGIALVERGVHGEAREALVESLALARGLGDAEAQCRASIYASMLELDAGRPLLAHKHLAAAAAAGSRTRFAQGVLAGSLGVVELVRGHPVAAARELAQADLSLDDVGNHQARATFLAFWGACEAMGGRLRDARAHFDEAAQLVEGADEGAYPRVIAQTLALVLDVRTGERSIEAARAALSRIEQSAAFDGWADVRVACRLARSAIQGAPPAAPERTGDAGLLTTPGARWFSLDGARRIDLSRRARLRALLDRLVSARLEAPGAWIPADALLAHVWPEDRGLSARLLRTRLHVSMSTLRRLGLRDVLESDVAGYRLAPALEVARLDEVSRA